MIVFPCDRPIVKDLNSYYLIIDKFLEHYQGFLGSGGIYFNSPSAAGIVLFDEYRFLNAEYFDKFEKLNGSKAFDKILQTSSEKNFNVSVYEIDMDSVYYWAHIPEANALYKDLKSEFTDISVLVEKMKSERLTGYIEIAGNAKSESSYIFFNNGIIEASKKDSSDTTNNQDSTISIIANASESGGLFHVYQVQLEKKLEEINFIQSGNRQQKQVVAAQQKKDAPLPPVSQPQKKVSQDHFIEMLQLLLQMLEKIIKANKKIKIDFETLLKKIFVEKVEKYDFLDPFAAELIYENGRLKFYGKTSDKELVTAVLECALEVAERTGVKGVLTKNLAPWINKYGNDLNKFNIKL